jgi:hypothetical protein
MFRDSSRLAVSVAKRWRGFSAGTRDLRKAFTVSGVSLLSTVNEWANKMVFRVVSKKKIS